MPRLPAAAPLHVRARRPLLAGLLALLLQLGLAPGAAAHFIGLSDSAVQVTQEGVRILQTIPAEELRELDVASTAPPRLAATATSRHWVPGGR